MIAQEFWSSAAIGWFISWIYGIATFPGANIVTCTVLLLLPALSLFACKKAWPKAWA